MKIIRTVQAISQILVKNVARLCPESSKICLKSAKTSISSNLSIFWQFLAPFSAQKLRYRKFQAKIYEIAWTILFLFISPGIWKCKLLKIGSEKGGIHSYMQEVWFSRGVKKYSPYVYPPIFRGGARCRQVYPEGDRCIFFFQRTKKSQVYLLGVARCISRFSEEGWPPLIVFRCILA